MRKFFVLKKITSTHLMHLHSWVLKQENNEWLCVTYGVNCPLTREFRNPGPRGPPVRRSWYPGLEMVTFSSCFGLWSPMSQESFFPSVKFYIFQLKSPASRLFSFFFFRWISNLSSSHSRFEKRVNARTRSYKRTTTGWPTKTLFLGN